MILADESSIHSIIRVFIQSLTHSLAHFTPPLRDVSLMYALFFLPPTPPHHRPLTPFSPLFYAFFFTLTDPNNQQVIGGDRHDRLIPIPYSKSSTDQAVREVISLLLRCR